MQNDIKDKNKIIVIKDLYKSFGKQKVLRDINLVLDANENLVILGRSGVGKSVLIKCIVGLETFDKGSINVMGNDIKELSEFELNDLRKDIGFLFQGGALYDSMTVQENLLFPLERNRGSMNESEQNDLIDEVLESVGLLDAKHKMPLELSGGMKKRAGLARTLVLKPKVILYDEPTTGLDPFTAHEISELIVSVREQYKTAAIVVTHDMKTARITADRMIIMEQGEILVKGSYGDLKGIDNPIIKGFFN